MMNQKTVDPSPLTLALSPRGKRVKWKINCGGRGDNRKKILSLISDRVKYSQLWFGNQHVTSPPSSNGVDLSEKQ